MKHAWMPLLWIASACATPPAKQEARVEPLPVRESAFHVSDLGGDPETRRYRIKLEELLGSSADMRIQLAEPGDGTAGASVTVDPAAALGPVAEAIRNFVAPDTWDQDPRRTIYVDGADLVVRHSPGVLERVEALIDTMKANRDVLFTLRTRFVPVRAEDLAALEHLGRIQGGLAGVFDTRTLQEVLSNWSRHRWTGGPKLTVFHAQAGYIRIASNYAYIEGYEKDGPVYDPQPHVLWSGVELKARGVVNGPKADRWLLKIAVTSREIPNLPGVPSVRIGDRLHEMPVATENVAEGAFVLGPDQTLLILTRPVSPKPGRLGVVLIESTLISP